MKPREICVLDSLFLGLAAYCIGQFIFVLDLKAEHPDWRVAPCALMSLAWPYLTARRCVVFCRAYAELKRLARAQASARRPS
jgi:hypothetical protein